MINVKVVGPEHAHDVNVKKVCVDVNLNAQVDSKDTVIYVEKPSGIEAILPYILSLGDPVPDLIAPKGKGDIQREILDLQDELLDNLQKAETEEKADNFASGCIIPITTYPNGLDYPPVISIIPDEDGAIPYLKKANDNWKGIVGLNGNYRLPSAMWVTFQRLLKGAADTLENKARVNVKLSKEEADFVPWARAVLKKLESAGLPN